MGVYIYTAKSNTRKVSVNGEAKTVAVLSYAYKPTYNRFDDAFYKRARRMESILDAAGHKSRRKHVNLGINLYVHDFQEGEPVWEVQDSFTGVCIDDTFFGSEYCKKVGHLIECGKNRFRLVPVNNY